MILVLDDYPLSRQGLESVIRMYRPEEQVLQAGRRRWPVWKRARWIWLLWT